MFNECIGSRKRACVPKTYPTVPICYYNYNHYSHLVMWQTSHVQIHVYCRTVKCIQFHENGFFISGYVLDTIHLCIVPVTSRLRTGCTGCSWRPWRWSLHSWSGSSQRTGADTGPCGWSECAPKSKGMSELLISLRSLDQFYIVSNNIKVVKTISQ